MQTRLSRLRTDQTCLSLWERCRAATERACISYFSSRAYLMRICPRLALSVICYANASSPKGRAEKSERIARLTNQASSHMNLFACCSFRRGLRRATFLKEKGFWCANEIIFYFLRRTAIIFSMTSISSSSKPVISISERACNPSK